MSREALSLDISRVVSRVVSGEPIDTAENAAALAAKYPDLGMSPALIGQAIERAAGMVGMIKSAPEPAKPARMAVTVATPKVPAPTNGHGHLATVKKPETVAAKKVEPVSVAPVAMPVVKIPTAALSIEDDLAAAIDAEIGNLVAGPKPKPAPVLKLVSEAPTPVPAAVAPAAIPATVAQPTVTQARVETAAEPAVEETPSPATAAPPTSTLDTDQSSQDELEPERKSILSSFRRALFGS